MNNQIARLSTDLRRVSYFILDDEINLARKFIEKNLSHLDNIEISIGKHTLVETLKLIKNLEGGKEKAAERAMTASIILTGRLS